MSDRDTREDPAWAGFDWTPERYEDLIRRVVPGYHEQEFLVAEALRPSAPEDERGPFRILELGAGTGSLSCSLLAAFPEGELTAMDVSPVMLAECRRALTPFGERARVVEADIATADLGSGYHAVVSRLAIHHLRGAEKHDLYGRTFTALVPGGVFVNSDLIAGETEAEMEAMPAEWRDYMVAQGDDPDEWRRWLVGDDDYPATESEQIAGLAAAGFVEARTIWRQANFAMVRAIKPER